MFSSCKKSLKPDQPLLKSTRSYIYFFKFDYRWLIEIDEFWTSVEKLWSFFFLRKLFLKTCKVQTDFSSLKYSFLL